ncbi:Tryprostatin B 6-hydroxylase, partial [Cyphellophora attinorum]
MATALLGQVIPLASGFASYLLYFHRGERQLWPFRIVQFHLFVAAVVLVARQQYLSESFATALSRTAEASALYLFSLTTSTLTYRLFFNPLNQAVPGGPFLARLTKFRHTYQNRTLKSHQALLELHRRHGDFVRLGPNDISVTDPAAVQVISSPNSKCYKSEWYDNDTPLTSMHTCRDRAQHDRRRKIWSPAFSVRAIKGYETRIQKYGDMLTEGLTNGKFAKKGQAGINVSDVFAWYSFDVMGDLAFGRSFGCLDEGKVHWAIKLLSDGMKPAGLALPAWFFRVVIAIPGAAADYWRFIRFCTDQLDKRMAEHSDRDAKATNPDTQEEMDITHFLIDHYNKLDASDQREVLPMLQGDSRLIIVAGSDTTSACLTYLFYWLAKLPEIAEKIRKETDSCRLKDDRSHFDDQKLAECETLNGAINEALRLNPPVPSGIFRKTPKEGVHIGEKFIPGDTIIQMPWYVMGHDPKNYTSPDQFLPERWSPSPHNPKLVHHKDAFQSFNSGPYGCIGKNLALMELRTVTAQLLDRFEVKFAEGEDGRALMEDSIDHFTTGLGGL